MGVTSEVLPDVTKGASQKYFMSWEGNVGEGVNPTRLHIMSEMFAAFHGMKPVVPFALSAPAAGPSGEPGRWGSKACPLNRYHAG